MCLTLHVLPVDAHLMPDAADNPDLWSLPILMRQLDPKVCSANEPRFRVYVPDNI
jgi:hypothetical protein